jgi:hypothetical protein
MGEVDCSPIQKLTLAGQRDENCRVAMFRDTHNRTTAHPLFWHSASPRCSDEAVMFYTTILFHRRRLESGLLQRHLRL